MLQKYDSRNDNLIVNVGGELSHRDQARISPFDSLAQGGDGVWEGLRLYNGKIFRLDAHLSRLRSSALALAIKDIPSDEEMTNQIARTLKANDMTDGVHIRLTLSRGEKITSGMDPRLNTKGSLLIVLAEYKPPVYDRSGLRLMTSTVRRFRPDTLDPNIHHNNLVQSILAKIQANAAGVDDALMLDTQGFVAETNATHVFIVEGGVLKTPTTRACPEGITRDTVLALCDKHKIPYAVEDISLTAVYRATEMFCTGTMGEIAAVAEVDGRKIGTGEKGEMSSKISKLYQDYVKIEGSQVCD
ncbi:MAG: aminotransferase class IV, partial [Planctomycetota bacterium]|nr:aminotransferase class IV [Planctomycetota bacterium]